MLCCENEIKRETKCSISDQSHKLNQQIKLHPQPAYIFIYNAVRMRNKRERARLNIKQHMKLHPQLAYLFLCDAVRMKNKRGESNAQPQPVHELTTSTST